VSLPEKVNAVERVFSELDQSIAAFQQWSTLSCKLGCGKCCFKPDIEATVLEFLPLAYHLYQDGKAEIWLERLKLMGGDLCAVLNPRQIDSAGLCSEYIYRGLICRLFGYSARINKYNQKQLVTCQIIKEEKKEAYELASERINASAEVPVTSHYYLQLHSIDPDLGREFYPINVAIRQALETVLHYYAYRS